jgi:hypothetical protein
MAVIGAQRTLGSVDGDGGSSPLNGHSLSLFCSAEKANGSQGVSVTAIARRRCVSTDRKCAK